jgi:hypothetical protein
MPLQRRIAMLASAGLALALVLVVGPAGAQVPPGGVPIPSPADYGDPGDRFGSELEVDGDWMVATGLSREAYFVYERVGNLWTRRQRIVPPTLGQAGPASIDLRGNRLLIARAFGEGFAGEGRVWVYERTAPGADFALAATIAPDAGQGGDRFGYGLAQSADRIFVGASGRDETTTDQGAVYVFRRDAANWVQEQKIVMPDPTIADRFGFGLDFDGEDLLIGARQHRPTGGAATRRGAVYIYRLQAGSWTQVQKLEQPVGVNQGTQFGYDVAAQDGRAAISAPGGGIAAVYLAERDAGGDWSYTVLPPALAGTGRFPSFIGTVDLAGDLVGATVQSALDAGLTQVGPQWGVVWRRAAGTWTVTAQVQRPDGNTNETGGGVRFGNGWLLVGAPRDNASASNDTQGSILAYSLVDGAATPRQRLWHGNGSLPDYLGFNVAIDGDHAVATAPGADTLGGATNTGALHFLRRDAGGGWAFVQSIPGTADSGLPLLADLVGDLAYVSYPDAQAAGLPAPMVRVFRRDGAGTWAALCDLQPPPGVSGLTDNRLVASAVGAMATVDGLRIAFWPAPTGASCPAGSLMPVASSGGFYFGVNLAGTVASLEWNGVVNGAQRNGVDVFDFIGGTWTFAQAFTGSAVNGLSVESREIGMPDGLNRVLMIHVVPVSTIDRRFDAEVWTRPAPGSPFVLTRTITAPTATNGFEGGFFVGDLLALADPSIGPNSGLAIYDIASGARLQSIVPPGLTVDDDQVASADFSGERGILGVPNENRGGVNHSGMVYLVEALPNRGGPPTFGTVVPVAVPSPGGDALFFDDMETAAY